jgi:hypothetical protein
MTFEQTIMGNRHCEPAQSSFFCFRITRSNLLRHKAVKYRLDCLLWADRLLPPSFHFGLIVMTFEQTIMGNRHCEPAQSSFFCFRITRSNLLRHKAVKYRLDCLLWADRLLPPSFHFGLIVMTFEQTLMGNRHCEPAQSSLFCF